MTLNRPCYCAATMQPFLSEGESQAVLQFDLMILVRSVQILIGSWLGKLSSRINREPDLTSLAYPKEVFILRIEI